MNGEKRRSGLEIMMKLIGLVKPLFHVMIAAVLLGTAGYLCAIFITILAGSTVLSGLGITEKTPAVLLTAMVIIAVLRGFLHYAEQYCNHYIAFRLLAIIRHKVFMALRKLCPAKLECRDKGNLISLITTDIELLEVFYAHTISPVVIAVLTSAVMTGFIGHYHPAAGIFALCAYLIVGIFIPLWNGRRGGNTGLEFRNLFGNLNSFVLDSLRGLDETIQYGQGEKREKEMEEKSSRLAGIQKKLSKMEGGQKSFTDFVILVASLGMLVLTVYLWSAGSINAEGVMLCTIAMMGSFGPVVALSGLSNNLNQTLASGERVLSILEEEPVVEEVPVSEGCEYKGENAFTGAETEHVEFSYEDETILKDFSVEIPPGKITGIHGVSGSGKSTLLKLLMRFWDTDKGTIKICEKDIRKISTENLRNTESYVTQETHLFKDTIANNIAIGKPGATRTEIQKAAEKASIHDFIMSLPEGYDTQVGELGDTLSGGERQRIGIARAFLHDSPFILMDEPTSNLDSLNEGIVLKSLKEEAQDKTVVLVSHRKSTMNVADIVIEMENGRRS